MGLVGALATVAFLLWIQASMQHQIEVVEPLARLSRDLRSSVNQSSAELRGWIAYGDVDAKHARTRIWREDIVPYVQQIREASAGGADGIDDSDIDELTRHLQDVKYLQWLIEDTARTPGNVPARALYKDEVRPLRARVGLFLQPTDERPASVAEARQELARSQLRSLVIEADQAMARLVLTYTPAQAMQVRTLAAQTMALARQLGAGNALGPDRDVIVQEVLAFARRGERVVALRGASDWNRAEAIFEAELKPLELRTDALAEAISTRVQRTVTTRNRRLFRWSFVVLALALVVGGLSAVSIYVSYQMEDRMERALAKAKSLGQYVLEERIGGGGMGQVFRARHALLRRPAAVKVLRRQGTLDQEARARFLAEVQLTSTLSHPNTVAVYDYGETREGLLYYAMELLGGVSLEQLVAVTGPLPASRVVHVLQQVCGSLAEAHASGLLHRDIKPSNIMISQVGGVCDVVKVLDFGLVTDVATTAERPEGVVGTPLYLAPETVVSAANASPRSEMYAVGAVGYYLLTGAPLYDYADVDQVLAAQCDETPQLPSARLGAPIPADLEAIVVACLAKDPDDRPASAAALESLLEEADLAPWTKAQGQAWWAQYGESVRAEALSTVLRDDTSTAIQDLAIGPRTRT